MCDLNDRVITVINVIDIIGGDLKVCVILCDRSDQGRGYEAGFKKCSVVIQLASADTCGHTINRRLPCKQLSQTIAGGPWRCFRKLKQTRSGFCVESRGHT